jgi:hypothetical protein
MQILKMIYDLYPSDLASVADGFGGAQARGEGSDDEEKQRLCSGTRHCILRCWKLGAALLQAPTLVWARYMCTYLY